MTRRSIGIPLVASAFALALAAACGSSDCDDDLCFAGEGGTAGEAGAEGQGGADSTTGGSSGGNTASGGMATGGGGVSGGAAGATDAGNSSGGADGGQDGEGGADGGGADGGGQGGQGGSGGEPEPPCDKSKSPLEDLCVVNDEQAIFVDSERGIDSAVGTKSDPVASFERAVELATDQDKRVIACEGTYPETLSLTGDLSLEIYGGFDCDDWVPTTQPTIVAPEAESGVALSGVALMANAVGGSVLIDGVEFHGADADPSEPGASSIGAMIVASEGMTLRRVRIIAGVGTDGASGEEGGYEGLGEAAETGNAAMGEVGASTLVCMSCPAEDSSLGAFGGPGGLIPGDGGQGAPDYGDGGGGEGEGGGECKGLGTGGDGSPGPETEPGAGALRLGVLSASGWISAGGDAGADGKVGQGGGGGGGGKSGGGGGGGCGGCGGKGGAAGGGGGASIGLVVIDTEVVLEASEIVTDDGGDGGNGSDGQDGQLGGFGGDGGTGACDGGAGGPGAQGAAGGGGAGGLSVGILWSGVEPSVPEDVVIELGAAGDAGLGGEPSVNDGAPGDSTEILNADDS